MANVKLSAIPASVSNLASGDGIVGYQAIGTSDVLFSRAQLGAGIGPAGLGAALATSLAVGGATLGSNILAVAGGNVNFANTLSIGGTFTTGTLINVAGWLSINGASGSSGGVFLGSTHNISWASTTTNPTAVLGDTILTRKAAATLQLGAADAASPVAQTLGVQSVVAGTTNTAGTVWTLIGSLSTGTGTSGDIVLKTGATGTTGTAQNAATTALTIKGATQRVIAATTINTGAYTVATLPTGVTGDRAYVTDALAPAFLGALTGGSSTVTPVFYNGSAWVSN